MNHFLRFLFVVLLCSSTICYSQPAFQWQRAYGGSSIDGANAVQRTADGGYIFAGYSECTNGDVTGNHGMLDCWVVKTDDTGHIMWEHSYGGSQNDQVNMIQVDINGGYIIAGSTASSDGDITGFHGGLCDAWILKIDDTGAIVWQKVMGSTGFDFANYAINTTDSGYIVTGSAGGNDGDVSGYHGNNDLWVIRLNKAGAVMWNKVLGSTGYEYGFYGSQTSDGGYIFASEGGVADGDITSVWGGGADAWIVKLDDTGAIQWQKTYGGSKFDIAVSLAKTLDGGYIFTGATLSSDGQVTGFHTSSSFTNQDIWVVKIDDTGAVQWENCFGGTGNEFPGCILQALDGTYVLDGANTYNDGDVTGNHGGSDFWLLDISRTGSILWQKSFGGFGNDTAIGMVQTPDSGFVMTGGTSSFGGEVIFNHGTEDFWAVKLYKNDTTILVNGIQSPGISNINVFPTLTTGKVNITLPGGFENAKFVLSTVVGSAVRSFSASGLENSIDISGNAPGLYLLKVINGEETRTFKIVLKN